MILYIFFGEYTVRKLRKIADIKDELGFDPVGGKDIINVAMALTFPRKWNRVLRSSPLGDYFANADKLYQYTKVIDRIIARILAGLLIFVTISILSMAFIKYVILS